MGGFLLLHIFALQGNFRLRLNEHVVVTLSGTGTGGGIGGSGTIISIGNLLILVLIETTSHLVKLDFKLGLLLETRLKVQ
ncbi:hypothetical protein PG996_013320 [Apiospora saccharicola]|uniref:Uncharacterized protein n=1 Tax=Apiospora saccharicola TaxID=335842 RepID=A0ABR1U7X4_9PEZI